MNPSYTDIAACLRDRAEHRPEKMAFEFWSDYGRQRTPISYEKLHREACSIAAYLKAHSHSQRQDRILLVYPSGLEFVSAFFGCLYAGRIAVPVPAPHPLQLQRTPARLRAVIRDAEPAAVLGSGPSFQWLADVRDTFAGPEFGQAQFIHHDSAKNEDASAFRLSTRAEDIAFLQYTSGSTSSPKGVILSHENLVANTEMISRTLLHPLSDVRGVFWLPLYHDMGLIGAVLANVYREGTTTLMSPLDFLKNPFSWLYALSETRANISGAPDFAYQMAVDRITEEDRAELDLSEWRVAFSAADRIRPNTLRCFAEAFAQSGFRKESLYGAYGLAEATLLVSAGWTGAAENLREPVNAVPTPDGEPLLRVSCGAIGPGIEVAIVDGETGAPCEEGCVGEIHVRGANVALGYWGRPEASEKTFRVAIPGRQGEFLRTGDSGFVLEREIYVTGRIKDLVIVGGQNHHPEDIETTASESHALVRSDGCAAFGVEVDNEERVVVAIEVQGAQKMPPALRLEIVNAVRAKISKFHMLAVHDIVLLSRGRLPKTSSGKLQRHLCREQYVAGELHEKEASAGVA